MKWSENGIYIYIILNVWNELVSNGPWPWGTIPSERILDRDCSDFIKQVLATLLSSLQSN